MAYSNRNLLRGVACMCILLGTCLAFSGCKTDPPSGDSTSTADSGVSTTEPDTTPGASTESASETPTGTPSGGDTEPDPVVSIYPVPRSVTQTEGSVSAAAFSVGEGCADYEDLLTGFGLKKADVGLPITVTMQDLSGTFERGADEGYILKVTPDGISVTAQTDRGAYYAFITLSQLLTENKNLPCVTVQDAPTIPSRGVIEGFYGTPWSHAYRLSLFAFMGEQKMNTYIYAPKDDAKHKAQWRVKYTGKELRTMTELVETATANRVRFVYAISPGADINLGSGYDADFDKLCAKCEQLYGIGVRDFAILLDDIPTLDAEGHAKLLNDFQQKFVATHEGVSDLICITTEYTDPFLTSYTDKIALLLDPALRLMWTGPGVCPPSITEEDLKKINRLYGRNVFIWWNYPVNDVLVDHLYMGTCEGLETTLYNSISGLTANPMNQGNASFIPLFTTADYLWNPTAYDKDASLKAAAAWFDPALTGELLDFIDMVGASPLNNNTSTVALGQLIARYKTEGAAVLDELIAECDRLCTVGKLRDCRNQDFVTETADWIDKAEAYAHMASLYFRMEKEYAGERRQDVILSLVGEYSDWVEKSKSSRVVSPDVLTPLLTSLTTRLHQLVGLAGDVTCQPATAITNCAHYQDYAIDRINDGDDSTYFWSAGTMWQAASGTTGYIGLNFGSVIDLHNLYIATGENGRDVFAYAAIEYSADGKTWTELCAGTFGPEVYLTGLNLKAQYVRMRNTDTTSTSWVKVRVFEANTTRVVTSEAGQFSVTTSLSVYMDNTIDRVLDGKDGTFFWSNRGVESGDFVQIDLGIPSLVHSVVINTGVNGHPADYMADGELLWSADGYCWNSLGKPGQGLVQYENLEITARYIKLVSRSGQTSWFTMSRFDVDYEESDRQDLYTDTDFASAADLYAAYDGNVLTSFSPDPAVAAGHTLTVDVSSYASVRLICRTAGEGTTVTLTDKDGKVLSTANLTADMTLDCTSADKLVISFGEALTAITEIVRQ